MSRRFANFAEFYPFYLGEHNNSICRRLHFAGTTCALLILVTSAWVREPLGLLAALLVGYGFAWVGHVFFEKNRPATFSHPFYSFLGDWVMWKDMITGRVRF